jgi:fluoride exporter
MQKLLAVFIGGGLGSIARYGVSRLILTGELHIKPLATFFSNILATAMLGLILFFVVERFQISEPFQAFLIIGFCGGFSTFSTFSFETFELMRSGHTFLAIFYALSSMLLGLLVLLVISKSL